MLRCAGSTRRVRILPCSGSERGLGACKRSIALDTRHPRRIEVLRKLCDWADVVVDNSRPGDLEERGFGYRQASGEHPELVWCSITGFGQDGPYALWPGARPHLYRPFRAARFTRLRNALASPDDAVSPDRGHHGGRRESSRRFIARHASRKGCQLDISLSESATWVLSGFDALINDAGFSIPTITRPPPLSLWRRPVRQRGRGRSPYLGGALCGSRFGWTWRSGGSRRTNGRRQLSASRRVFCRRSAADWVADLGPRGAAIGPVNVGADLLDGSAGRGPTEFGRRRRRGGAGQPDPHSPGFRRTRSSPRRVPRCGRAHTGGASGGGFQRSEVDRLLDEGVVSE